MTKQSIEQLQQSINTLQKQLDAFAATQQTQKLEMWKPKCAKNYFFAYQNLNVGLYLYNEGDATDASMVNAGNCFPTHELAEYYAKRRAARQRLEMLALAENGMKPYEWTQGRDNYCIVADGYAKLTVDCYISHREQQYFPTKEAAQRVLDAMT